MPTEPTPIVGRVVHGQHLGRSLGAATANLELDGQLQVPRGVFVARVDGGDLSAAPAMAYVGTRPSVTARGATVLEVHVLDFDGDLYGCRLSVRLYQRVRGDERMPSLAALAQRIAENLALVRGHFATGSS